MFEFSETGNELKAQFDMMCNTKTFTNGKAGNYKLKFIRQNDGLPARVKVAGLKWSIMEACHKNSFHIVAIQYKPDGIHFIKARLLTDVLSMIHEGRISGKL